MPSSAADKINQSGTFWNYISAIISMTIMLYLLGAWGALAITANQFINFSKENIAFYIELKDDANEATVFAFQKKLEAATYTKKKSVRYIPKEQALDELKDDAILTEEDVLLFGENLLPNMLRFTLNKDHFADYAQVVAEIENEDFVNQVFYTDAIAQNISTKVYRLELILIVLMIFFIFVVLTIIKNTLKLLLIANKSVIRTMQMVGATVEKMAKPYLRQSIYNGLLSSLAAIVALWGSRYLLEIDLGQLSLNINIWMAFLSGLIVLVGLLLSWGATRQSVYKHLKKPVDEW